MNMKDEDKVKENILLIMLICQGYGFVISRRHQFLGRASWLKYLKENSTNPGYGKLGCPEDVDVVVSPSLQVLDPPEL